jgi:transcriptional regulator GlxA family with amidase domain
MMKVGIFVFPDVELLDFAGPFEVFSVTAQLQAQLGPFQVFLLGETMEPVRSINGLRVLPDYTLDNQPGVDLLILAGGDGSKAVVQNEALLGKLRALITKATWVLSICSGARILAKLGHLQHRPFTTHHQVFDDVLALAPTAIPQPDARFVYSGQFITSAGISAGIDASLFLVEKLLGTEIMQTTRQYMEYTGYSRGQSDGQKGESSGKPGMQNQ